jgi:hypothetical protein
MRTKNKTVFNIHRDGDFLLIFRNHTPEVRITCPTISAAKEFEKYLRNILPQDYDEYRETYDLRGEVSTIEWIVNLIKTLAEGEGREILYLFKRIREHREE